MNSKNKGFIILACCAFYGCLGLNAIVSPAIAGFAEMFPDQPLTMVQQLQTLPSLISVPVTLLVGYTAGKLIKFKPYVLLACALMAIGGMLPFFYHESLYFMLGSRCIYGFGFGICHALMSTIIVRSFDGEMQSKVLGWGASSLAVINFIIPIAAGNLANMNVNYVWLLHIVPAIVFLFVLLWLPEPAPLESPVDTKKEKAVSGPKPRITLVGWVVIIGFGLTVIAYYPLWVGVSTVVVGEGLGTAAEAGWIISIVGAGNFVAGLIFAKYYAALKHFALPVGMLVVALGLVLLFFGNLPILFVGAFICGFGHAGLIMSSTYRLLPQILDSTVVTSANGFVGALASCGGFLAPFWMAFIANVAGTASPRIAFIVGAAVLVVLAVVVFIATKKPVTEANTKVAQ